MAQLVFGYYVAEYHEHARISYFDLITLIFRIFSLLWVSYDFLQFKPSVGGDSFHHDTLFFKKQNPLGNQSEIAHSLQAGFKVVLLQIFS